jgi:phage shock protein A
MEFTGLAKEMAMSTRRFDEFDNEIEEVEAAAPVVPEASPSTKLERRRKIEDLFEEKRLREELAEFG